MLGLISWSSPLLQRIMRVGLIAAIAAMGVANSLSAKEPAAIPPIKELEKLPVLPEAFNLAGGKPAEIRSAGDAAKYFGAEDAAKLVKQVDFTKQVVLLFAWRGSGQDKLSFTVAESSPEQIMFTRERGRTKDLRPHVKIFVLRSNVKWSVK